ncbi:YeaC family protein [Endozoicomonas atrinae]|uniref:YeaC family protein n=1 Tax=Endozoicomonas atrinae TaxID=1333660 RepID=UPI000826DD9F|nr:DUF1315 family protein [Endozoicomonas atrinae]
MQLDAFLKKMTPAIHQSLKLALELGRWPDGRVMTQDERDASLQAVIAYEYENLPESERVGYMPAKCKSDSKASIGNVPAEEATILRFKN